MTFPVVWLGRKILDQHQTTGGAAWTTMFVHFVLGFTFGVRVVRAVTTYQEWYGWVLTVPSEIGLVLVIITGTAFLLVVANLALEGLGAPFAIAHSKKLAIDWFYAWTRNPVVLAALALLTSCRNLVSVSIVCGLGAHRIYTSIAFLRKSIRRTGIGNPIWNIVPRVQIQNADVVSKETSET